MSDPTHAAGRRPQPSPLRNRQVQVGALVLLAVAIGIVAWLWGGKGGDEAPSATSTTQSVEPTGPIRLSQEGLTKLAGAIPQPIYWMGPSQGMWYELTRLSDGAVYVRYLPRGVPVDGRQGELTIIATYAFDNAAEALRATEGEHLELPGDGVALVGSNPTSVYLAFPGSDYQVEVYDPDPEKARQIAESGKVAPVA